MSAKVAVDTAGMVGFGGLRGERDRWMRGYTVSSFAATLAIAVLAASHNLSNAPKQDDYSLYTRDLDRSGGSVADDSVVLQFAHAAPNASRLDVYMITTERSVVISRYVSTLNLAEASAPFELALERGDQAAEGAMLTGKVVIELRAADAGQTLYKSDAFEITEQSRVLLAIVSTVDQRAAPIELVSVGGATRLSVQ